MMVRLEDVRRIPRDFRETTRVKDVMIAVPRTLQVEDRISDVMPELSSSPAAALPVEKAGRIIGLVRYADLSDILQLKSLEERVEKTAA
jgi:CBS-domain-containing membrane protein